MILRLLAWLVVTLAIGWAAVMVVWPGPVRWKSGETLLRGSLAVGLGFGISSCAFFVAMVLLGPTRLAAFGADAVALAALIALARSRAHSLPADRYRLPNAPAPDTLDRQIGWGIVALTGVAAVATLAVSMRMPHGDWDAWGIYNLTARFIYLGGSHWHRAFTPGLGIHPDYPLLLPGSVVRGWLYTGSASSIVPAIAGMLFAYALAGLVAGGVWILRGRRHAAAAAMVLIGTPFFLTASASQYADLPLTLFFVGAIVLYALARRLRDDETWMLIGSGLCAGLAAWTKNEGLLFVLIACAGLFVLHHRVRRRGPDRRVLAAFLWGLVPVLVVVGFFKLTLAPPNDLVSGQGSGTLPRLVDASRYWLIVSSGLRFLLHFPVIPVVILLALAGLDRDAGDRRAKRLAAYIVLAMAAGYFTVYLTTPLDLALQIHRSLDRLIMQLWPLALFVAFMALRLPEQAAAAGAGS
ncbi:MAG TPA: glycosyltransferase family 39 protein [Gemmatimonadaceae bacterium]